MTHNVQTVLSSKSELPVSGRSKSYVTPGRYRIQFSTPTHFVKILNLPREPAGYWQPGVTVVGLASTGDIILVLSRAEFMLDEACTQNVMLSVLVLSTLSIGVGWFYPAELIAF